MDKNNQHNIVFVLLAASIFFNIVPTLAAPITSDNPYSMQWWYQLQHQHKMYSGDNYDDGLDDDDDNDKKHKNQKHGNNGDNSYYKPKTSCSNYDGTWNGKECVIQDETVKAEYEDYVCDDPKDTQKYSNVCGGNSNKQVDEKRMVKEHRDTNSGLSKYPIISEEIQKQPRKISPVNGQFFGYPDVKPATGYGPSLYDEADVKAEQDRINAEKDKKASQVPQDEADQIMSAIQYQEEQKKQQQQQHEQDDNDDSDKKGDDTPKSDNDDGDNTAKDDSNDDDSSSDDSSNSDDGDSDSGGDSESDKSDNKDSKDSGDN